MKFLKLDRYLYKSDAWRALGCIDRCLYLELLARYDGTNNGRIGLGCREAGHALNVGRDTISRSFRKLRDHGFVVPVKLSGFNVKGRASTEYRLTEYKCDVTGELPTKEFMKWAPHEKTTVRSQGQQVRSQGRKDRKITQKQPDSPISRTVKPKNSNPQSDLKDTYRYTIREEING